MVMRVLILILLVLLSYGDSLQNGFALDDLIQVSENPLITGWATSFEYFFKGAFPGDLYRPLTFLSYALDYSLYALEPWGYHLSNLLIYILVVCLAYSLLAQIFTRQLALVAVALFAVHPVHVEVVANVSGRAELLAALGVLSGLLCVLALGQSTRSGLGRILFATGLFASACFGIFSKESAVCLLLLTPLVLVLTRKHSLWRAICSVEFALVLAATIFYLSARVSAIGSLVSMVPIAFIDNPLVYVTDLERIYVALALLGRYLCLAIFPLTQLVDYSYPVLAGFVPSDANFILSQFLTGLVVAVLSLALLVLGRRQRFLSFSLVWFFACFAVTANIIFPIGTIFAERLLFLASLGATTFVASLIWLNSDERLSIKSSLAIKIVQFVLFTGILVTGVLVSRSQVLFWKSNQTLLARQIQFSPSIKARLNYSALLQLQNDYENAYSYAHSAYLIRPEHANAMVHLGDLKLKQGDLVYARFWYLRALSVEPKSFEAALSYSKLFISEQNFVEAERWLRRAMQYNPPGTEAPSLLVTVLLSLNRVSDAQQLFNTLWKLVPNDKHVRRLHALMTERGLIRFRPVKSS